jgi:predicted aminopeptidase
MPIRDWPTVGAQVPPYLRRAAKERAVAQDKSVADVVRDGLKALYDAGWFTPPRLNGVSTPGEAQTAADLAPVGFEAEIVPAEDL